VPRGHNTAQDISRSSRTATQRSSGICLGRRHKAGATTVTACLAARTIKVVPKSPSIQDGPPLQHDQHQSKKRSRRRGRYIDLQVTVA
jgi:hypothetical protein